MAARPGSPCDHARQRAGAKIIEAIGGRAPENPAKLVIALSDALTEVCAETAQVPATERGRHQAAPRAGRASAQTHTGVRPSVAADERVIYSLRYTSGKIFGVVSLRLGASSAR